jgi:glycosyltransferase involved in cell wall biosynthesis
MRAVSVPQQPAAKEKTVFHIGAMDWKPNSDGVNWLVEKVWPLVLNQIPDAELHLAGKGMNTSETPAAANVFLHGEVESAADFMSQYNVMAVPLHSGGGIKVKVVEGMFAGKPIVTTPVGAEGIAYTQGVDLHVVSAPGEFAEKLIQLLNNSTLARETGMNAQKTAGEHHELIRVTEKLCDFYRTIFSQ